MINYKKLPDRSVLATTNNAQGEIDQLRDLIVNLEFADAIHIPDEKNEDGVFEFTIPKDVVGEFAECVYDIDGGELDDKVQVWNKEALAKYDERH